MFNTCTKAPISLFPHKWKRKSGVRIWAESGRYYHQSYILPLILFGTENTYFLNMTPGNFPQYFPHLTVTYLQTLPCV